MEDKTVWTVFYSWQSDLPNATNRGFIQKALGNAVKSICDDDSIQVEPVVDRDTLGVPGAPDIADTILEKIEQSQAFVCDVSIINKEDPSRSTPNPNVLIELGYALKALGWPRVMMVMNTAFGEPEVFPFDLKMKRAVTYCMPEAAEDRAVERRKLSSKLERGLRIVLEDQEEQVKETDLHRLRAAFRKAEAAMPDLVAEMRSDLRSGGHEFTREFLLVKKSWVVNFSDPHFRYYHEEHDNLTGKIQVLENYGFVIDVTTSNVKKYRMTEEFVELLLAAE
jgi:hypothetical protein